ncbi:TPA: hypothetical protein RQJ81_004645 [Vibrio vulnificus]|nr:hypothetical protein [Vibrio vulnificus]HDY8086538.1 hypothetical protein [Vibrio vulnificus]HDY8169278.1 hypothetical protein [Vibrio vulnificus]
MQFHVLYEVGATKLPIAGAAIWSVKSNGELLSLICTTGTDGVAQYDPDTIDASRIRISAFGFSSRDRQIKMPCPPVVLEKINSSAFTGFSANSGSAYWREKGGKRFFEFFADGTMRSFYGSDLTRYSLTEGNRYSMLSTRPLSWDVIDKYQINLSTLCIFWFPKPSVMYVRSDMMKEDEAIEFELVN